MSGNNNGRRSRGPRKPSAKSLVRSLEHRIQGVPFTPSGDPTPVVRPWHNVVAANSLITPGTAVNVTIASLFGDITTLTGITGFSEIRVREIRVWGAPGGTIQVYVFNPSTTGELYHGSDLGNLSSRPRVGYVLPMSVSTSAYKTGTQVVFSYNTSDPGTLGSAGEYHVLLQFR
jgi:hypothetical protein